MVGHQEVVFRVVVDGSTRAAYYFDENLVQEVIRQYLATWQYLEGGADNGEEQGGEEDLDHNGQFGGAGEEDYWGDDENEEIEGKGLFRCVPWHAPPIKRKWSDVSD